MSGRVSSNISEIPTLFLLGAGLQSCYNGLMKVGKKLKPALDVGMITVEEDVRHLLEIFEFYLSERHLGRPVSILQSIVQDMRILLGRLLTEYFLQLTEEREAHFCAILTTLLSERAELLPWMNEKERDYIDYVLAELLMPFEWAQEVKAECPHDKLLQRLIAVDIPLLDSFEFRLRDKIRLVANN